DGAGLGAAAIDEDSAGAALAGVAADVSAGQIQLFAQEVHKECARLDVRLAQLAVHVDRNLSHGVPRRSHSLHKNSVNSQGPVSTCNSQRTNFRLPTRQLPIDR